MARDAPSAASDFSMALRLAAAATTVAGLGTGFAWLNGHNGASASASVSLTPNVPSRAAMWTKLADSSVDKPFDVLIIGGGATGTGCALDAATRCAAAA